MKKLEATGQIWTWRRLLKVSWTKTKSLHFRKMCTSYKITKPETHEYKYTVRLGNR